MVLFGLVTVLGVILQSCERPKTGIDQFAKGSLKKLVKLQNPPTQPRSSFVTEAGETTTLADFEGKIIIVNIWATWCPPCIAEMPTLDRLQALRGGSDFDVVTISIDNKLSQPSAWMAENGLTHLTPWFDANFTLPDTIDLPGVPLSVLYNRHGQEIARLSGEANWSSPEALVLIDNLLQIR